MSIENDEYVKENLGEIVRVVTYILEECPNYQRAIVKSLNTQYAHQWIIDNLSAEDYVVIRKLKQLEYIVTGSFILYFTEKSKDILDLVEL